MHSSKHNNDPNNGIIFFMLLGHVSFIFLRISENYKSLNISNRNETKTTKKKKKSRKRENDANFSPHDLNAGNIDYELHKLCVEFLNWNELCASFARQI